MTGEIVLEIAMTPADARARLRAAVNRPPRRFLGVLKVSSEFVGVVDADQFEVWERRAHAIHAIGRIERAQRGSRVLARFTLAPRTRVLLVAFFALYVAAGLGVATLPEQPALAPFASLGVLLAGGLAMSLFFVFSARRQRSDLHRFISGVFEGGAGG